MKKITKRILALVVAMTMLLAAVPVYAAPIYADMEKTKTITFYPSSADNKSMETLYGENSIGYVGGTSSISLKSSNTSIATVTKRKVDDKMYIVYVVAKKTGTVTVTMTVNKKKYTSKVTIKKYENPISSIKVGKTTFSGSKFNKNIKYNVKYSQFQNKNANVTVKLKSGWKVFNDGNLEYIRKGWNKSEFFKNGGRISIKGGSGFKVIFSAVNTKTNQVMHFCLYFK